MYRGRGGRGSRRSGDPDWRLGAERGRRLGGGDSDDAAGWTVVMRLDPAWLAGGRAPPGVAFVIHDGRPQRLVRLAVRERAGRRALDVAAVVRERRRPRRQRVQQ